MVNWKKFFAEEDEQQKNSNDELEIEYYEEENKSYEKVRNSNEKSKLSKWFEEDYNETNSNDAEYDDFAEYENNLNKKHSLKKYSERSEVKPFEEEIEEEFDFDINKKEKFSFKNLFSKKKKDNEYEDDEYYNEYDEDYDDYDYFEDDEEQQKEKESFLTRFINIFKSEDKNDEFYEDDDTPEDYKTYLEKQKRAREEERDNELYFSDSDEENTKSTKKSPFSVIKNKISQIASYGLKDDDTEEIYEEPKKEKTTNKKISFPLFVRKKEEQINKDSDDFIIDYNNDNEDIAKTLELAEKNNYKNNVEEDNEKISDKLKSYGITAEDIKEVDLFGTREERRLHPTLAAVKVKRLLQNKNIETLGNEILFDDGKETLKTELYSKEEQKINNNEEDVKHISKNIDEITQLNSDFNKLNRKENKISTNSNYLKNKSLDTLDRAINEIRESEENTKKDVKDYDIKIKELSEKERRDKLKYTSVDDVLEGSEDLFKNDVDEVAKILVVPQEKQEEISEEVEQFRKDVYKEKTSKDLVESSTEETELDRLILQTNIVEKQQDEADIEIQKLEDNLTIIQEENDFYDDLEEITIEKVAKNSEPQYPTYDEIKKLNENENKNILDGYSDYNLDIEEIEALSTKSKIDSVSEKTNIDTLTREITPIFSKRKPTFNEEQYTNSYQTDTSSFQIKKRSERKEIIEETFDEEFETKYKKIEQKKLEEEKNIGIEYVEKLYSEDVKEYFADENTPILFKEYRTQDNGYRPVSRETIEKNQRKIDEIFEKYSKVYVPKRNTTDYVQQKLSSIPKSVGKYKPTPIYSSVYGSSQKRPTATNEKIEENTSTKKNTNKKQKNNKKIENQNLFQEIASQNETVWNIDLGNRVPKNKKNTKTK